LFLFWYSGFSTGVFLCKKAKLALHARAGLFVILRKNDFPVNFQVNRTSSFPIELFEQLSPEHFIRFYHA